MDGFKLDMDEARINQGSIGPLFLMQIFLKSIQTLHQSLWRRRNKGGIARPRSTNPVLRCAELAWLLVAAPPFGKKDRMHLADQAQRNRKTFTDTLQAMFQRGNIRRHFCHIIDGDAGHFAAFMEQQIREG